MIGRRLLFPALAGLLLTGGLAAPAHSGGDKVFAQTGAMMQLLEAQLHPLP